jgi:hypothetical protein
MCEQDVTVKIVSYRGSDSSEAKDRKVERFGRVLFVTESADEREAPAVSAERAHSTKPADSLVRIISHNASLDGDQEEQVIKRRYVESTWIEDIQVGICAPA